MPQSAKREALSELVATDIAPDHSALRAIRESRGYSLEALSLTCGLSTHEIANIENGKDHDPSRLRRIAAALRLPESALIDPAVLAQPLERRAV
ncbi:MAG: helix-turn-helix transcriptional regulator [Mesorhizobium sp.]